jgi:hypothetical protein
MTRTEWDWLIGKPCNETMIVADDAFLQMLTDYEAKKTAEAFKRGAELMQSAILYILNDYNIDPQAIADIVQMDYPVRPEDWAKCPRSET